MSSNPCHRSVPIRVLAGVLLSLALACQAPPEPAPPVSAGGVPFPDEADAGAWPGFGGPDGDFHVAAADLARTWSADGPPLLWQRPLGTGYSQVVAARGALFTMYRAADDERVVALRASDGEPIWEHGYTAVPDPQQQVRFGRGPNATPLILGDRLITLGYTGKLHALELSSGRVLWQRDLLADFAGEILDFGYSASPIAHEGKVIVLVGGERQAVLALDASDGAVSWAAPPGSVSYATPMVVDFDGQRQLLYFSADEIVGLDAADGTRRWSHPCVNQYRNNATNLIWDPDSKLLWVATQLDGGTRALRLSHGAAGTRVDEVWSSNKISIHFWNSILLERTVYASIGGQASILAAVDFDRGEFHWRERGFEQANLVQAGEDTILLDANGELALLRLSPEALEIVARSRVAEGTFWTPPTLVGPRLYVRDQESLRAFDLGR